MQRDELLLVAPWACLSAFASELALKSLLNFHDIAFARKHDLTYLFNLLPDDVQSKIRSGLTAWNFFEELGNVSESFVKTRYLEELSYSPEFLKSFKNLVSELAAFHEPSTLKVFQNKGGDWSLL